MKIKSVAIRFFICMNTLMERLVFQWDVNVPKNINNQYVHTYIQTNKHPDVRILLHLLWIQNLAIVTMGCDISHKNTK